LAAVAGGPDDITGTVALVARKLDLSPFFDVTPGKLPVIALSSQIGFAGHDVSINDVDSTVAGVRLRGHLAVKRSDATEFHGELGADRLDLAAALAMATGAIGRGLDEPLGRGVCGGARGAIALQTPRGILPGGLEIKPLSGNLRCDGASLAFDAKGSLGGGEVAGEITAQSGTDGLAVDARAQLSGVDGAALGWRGLPAPGGKTSLQFTASGRGRTAGVIAGALSGGGTVSIEQAKVGGLDPQAFEAAVAASDAGKVSGEASLRGLVAAALKGASLSVATAQIPFSLRDGGLRVPPTTLNGDGARLVVSGGYDITADQFDLRAELASTRVGTATDRPAIEIFAHGPPDRLNTSLDVGLFSSWLAVRAIDRETRRLESIERGEVPAQVPPPATAAIPAPAAPVEAPTPDVSAPPRDARRAAPRLRPAPPAPVAPPPPQASATPPAGLLPPLPPPIDVRPAPGAARPRPPRPPLALTPVPN
jgi:large subunit ribosomal protein L24